MRGKASSSQLSRFSLSPTTRSALSNTLPALALAFALFAAAYMCVTSLLTTSAAPHLRGTLERSLGYLLIMVGYLLMLGVACLLVRRRKAVAAERALLHGDVSTSSAAAMAGGCGGRGPLARLLPAGRILKDVDEAVPSAPWTGEHGKQCAVCLMDVEEGEDARQLRCAHVFHSGCAEEWLVTVRRNSCPMCLRKVVQGRDEGMCCVSQR